MVRLLALLGVFNTALACNIWNSCLADPDCCPSGTKCFEANSWYAQCRDSCTAGNGWTCRVLSTTTPAPVLAGSHVCNTRCSITAQCYQASWSVPCYYGGGSEATCVSAGGVWCPSMNTGTPGVPTPVPTPAPTTAPRTPAPTPRPTTPAPTSASTAKCSQCSTNSQCYQASWAVPCYYGGGSESTCVAAGGVWCPSSSLGGATPAPATSTTPSPQTPSTPKPATTPSGNSRAEHNRLVAYIGNWQACPTSAQVAQYTHLVVAFAVTYTWTSTGNICDTSCTIQTPLVCENAANTAMISGWQALGKKVILSFGGAGMGGSWDGATKCWEYCYGKESSVVKQLTNMVQTYGYDGVDIDYEYYYANGQSGSSFARGAEAQYFLAEITRGLKTAMPTKEISHAPMDADLVPGTAYFSVLQSVASSLDYIFVQYYNGITHPATDGLAGGTTSAKAHYSALVTNVFSGDATKVVFGFCISECSSYNIAGSGAVSILQSLAAYYPCNGGGGFWVVADDASGAWSKPVSEYLTSSTSC